MARDWNNYQAVQRFPILKGYIDMFSDVSYHNEMAGLLSFFYIQGQALVDYIRIPLNASHIDPRIHLFWIQPTRSGKTIAWEHTGEVLEEIGIKQDLFSTGTDAALIGSWNKWEEDGEQHLELIEGLLSGKKALNFDEGSILFETKKQHLQEVILYLQQAMNPIGTRANTLVKHMKDGKIETESRVSFWLTTFPPQGVREVVLTKGVFQRVLLLIRPWPIERREQVSEERMNTAFRRPPEYDYSIDDFAKYFSLIRDSARERLINLTGDLTLSAWSMLNVDDKEKIVQSMMYDMFSTDDSFHPLLNAHKDHMYELVRLMDPQMADVVCAFIPNLLNYTVILATHMSFLDEYTNNTKVLGIVNGDHVDMAAEIIYDLYEELVTWLESEVELQSAAKASKARLAAWKIAYNACKIVSVENRQGDWVRKSEMLKTYGVQNGGVSNNTQFLHYKEAKEVFTEVAVGVSKFVQLKTEQ